MTEQFDRAQLLDLYDAAIKLIIHQDQLTWRMTHVFAPFASLLLGGAIAPYLFANPPDSSRFLAVGASVVGLALSVSWGLLVFRSMRYHLIWQLEARRLEQLIGPEANLMGHALTFRQLNVVTFKIDTTETKVSASPGSFFSATKVLSGLYIAVVVAFLAVILIHLFVPAAS